MLQHYARTVSFEELDRELQLRVERGLVYRKKAPWGVDLALYTYTKDTVFNRAWDDVTKISRGLVLDHHNKKVIATPFPKFFNLGEHQQNEIPNLPFQVYDKVDGSLIILAHDGTEWFCATKGSFMSEQAKWAYDFLWNRADLTQLDPTYTYLFEAIYPENRIVVKYDTPELVVLGGYDGEGWELLHQDMEEVGEKLNLRVATLYEYDTIEDVAEVSRTLPGNREGFILRFYDGFRIKIKGDEYCRLHRLISRITPLAVWDMLRANEITDAVIKDIPEEFREDFEKIVAILRMKVMCLVGPLAKICSEIKHLSDKEVGLKLQSFPAEIRSFIFPFRKANGQIEPGDKLWEQLFQAVRPTGNKLDGYVASNSMNRVQEALNDG
jgi:RNA ligase